MIDHEQVMRRMLGREPTTGEFDEFHRMLSVFPPDIRNSEAAMIFITVVSTQVKALKDIVQNAGWESQQRIHKDLPGRIDEVALAAVRKIRDTIPIDSSDRFQRLLKTATIATAMVLFLGGLFGFALGERAVHHVAGPARSSSEVLFSQCLDAAQGAAAFADSQHGQPGHYDPVVYREEARVCAAAYADRRAAL